MAGQRIVSQYIYDAQRELNGQGEYLELFQAVQEMIRKLNAAAAWEFNLATHNLMFQKVRSGGTLAGTYGSAVVNGTGTTFDTAEAVPNFWTLAFGARKMTYMVTAFNSALQLTLSDPVGVTITEPGQPTTYTGVTYTLWRDRFLLPADCLPGRDIGMKGPFGTGQDGSGDIRKKSRLTHERRRNEFRLAGPPVWYTDDGVDLATNRPTIRVYPPPTYETEVRLLYYRRLLDPTDQNSVISVPLDFERMISLGAAAIVGRRKGYKGWNDLQTQAGELMNQMYALYAVSPGYSDEIEADDGGASVNREPIGLSGDLYTF